MTPKYAKTVAPKTEHLQSEQVDETQVVNNAGGYVFKVDPFVQLERFITLGSEDNTYYATEAKMTVDNFKNIQHILAIDGRRAVDTIVKFSVEGRVPMNSSCVFALAVASVHGSLPTREYANKQMRKVCRTATDMFTWADAVYQLRGKKWSRGTARAIARWYNFQKPKELAYQICKYPKSRQSAAMSASWTHRNMLRRLHIGPARKTKTGQNDPAFVFGSEDHSTIFRYAVKGREGFTDQEFEALKNHPNLGIIWAHEQAKNATDQDTIVRVINDYRIPRESIPNDQFGKQVWCALLNNKMPITAMIRNLGQMTQKEAIKPLSDETKLVADVLRNPEVLANARIHPITLLNALRVYQSGQGKSVNKKSGELRSTWVPVPMIAEALNDSFYEAFKHVEPTNKRFLLAVDISGSMDGGHVIGSPNLTPRAAAAVMAMAIARVERNYHMVAFCDHLQTLDIMPKMSLETVVDKMQAMDMGATNCALPMIEAIKKKLNVDAFVVLTDNETWCGGIHPYEALRDYRKRFNPDAKLVVMAMTATEFSIAQGQDKDQNCLEVAGLDSAAPKIISDFVAGRI